MGTPAYGGIDTPQAGEHNGTISKGTAMLTTGLFLPSFFDWSLRARSFSPIASPVPGGGGRGDRALVAVSGSGDGLRPGRSQRRLVPSGELGWDRAGLQRQRDH